MKNKSAGRWIVGVLIVAIILGALYRHLDTKITNKYSDGPGGKAVDAPHSS